MKICRTRDGELRFGILLVFAVGLAGSALVALVLSWPLLEHFAVAETCWSNASLALGAFAWTAFCWRNYFACGRAS